MPAQIASFIVNSLSYIAAGSFSRLSDPLFKNLIRAAFKNQGNESWVFAVSQKYKRRRWPLFSPTAQECWKSAFYGPRKDGRQVFKPG